MSFGGKEVDTNIQISAEPGMELATLWSVGRDLTSYVNKNAVCWREGKGFDKRGAFDRHVFLEMGNVIGYSSPSFSNLTVQRLSEANNLKIAAVK